jgi:hypothetical protein
MEGEPSDPHFRASMSFLVECAASAAASAFTMANGQTITRSIGFPNLRVDKYFTIDEVVFGEPGRSDFAPRSHFGRPFAGGRLSEEKLVAAGTYSGGVTRRSLSNRLLPLWSPPK